MIFIGCPAVIAIVMTLAASLCFHAANAAGQTDAPPTFVERCLQILPRFEALAAWRSLSALRERKSH
jgi:hypothetical protein